MSQSCAPINLHLLVPKTTLYSVFLSKLSSFARTQVRTQSSRNRLCTACRCAAAKAKCSVRTLETPRHFLVCTRVRLPVSPTSERADSLSSFSQRLLSLIDLFCLHETLQSDLHRQPSSYRCCYLLLDLWLIPIPHLLPSSCGCPTQSARSGQSHRSFTRYIYMNKEVYKSDSRVETNTLKIVL